MEFRKVAYNGQSLLLCWYSVIRQPEPMLSKVNAVDIIFYARLYSFSPDCS